MSNAQENFVTDYRDVISGANYDEDAEKFKSSIEEYFISEYENSCSDAYIMRIRSNGFFMIMDCQSAASNDLDLPDRVVGVIGTSGRPIVKRDKHRIRGLIGPTEMVFGADYDKGHFIAHAIGGDDLDMANIFPQLRSVNRGYPPMGIYRNIERYCAANAGALFFSRPIYTDATWIPEFIEIGTWRNHKLEAYRLPNRPESTNG